MIYDNITKEEVDIINEPMQNNRQEMQGEPMERGEMLEKPDGEENMKKEGIPEKPEGETI